MKVILTQGIQGSGKSTWVTEFLKTNKTYKRVNRDAIRHMIDDYSYKSEKLVQKIWGENVKTILRDGHNLVIDEMNLNPKTLKKNIEFIKTISPKVDIEIKRFDVSLDDAIERDKRRPFSVGERVIRNTYKKYIANKPERDCYDFSYIVKSDKKPAFIFDIDGTLALKHPDRDIFDGTKVGMDLPIYPVISILNALKKSGYIIIVLSGRDSKYRSETAMWLNYYLIDNDYLYMREEGDNRRDSIIKEELYRKYIEPKFNVVGVFDDRIQVLSECWQDKLGLFTFDVRQDAYGLNEY